MANSVPEVSAKIADVSLSMHLSSVKIMLYFKILDIATVLHTETYMIPHFGIQLKCSALSTLGGCDVDQGLYKGLYSGSPCGECGNSGLRTNEMPTVTEQ